MPVPVERITRERLLRWGQRLVKEHATPIILFGVGHDHAEGVPVVVTVEDITRRDLMIFIRHRLEEVERSSRE